MTEEECQRKALENQYGCNCGELDMKGDRYIVPVGRYDVRMDDRYLVPYIEWHKIGFVNHMAEPVIEAQYDRIIGEFNTQDDLVKVAVRYVQKVIYGNGQEYIYDKYKWGVLNSHGQFIVPMNYLGISISEDNNLFTLHDLDGNYSILDKAGNVIVTPGTYSYISEITKFHARVKIGKKWGLINGSGKVVLPVEYDNIWKISPDPRYRSARVQKSGEPDRYYFFDTEDFSPAKKNSAAQGIGDDTSATHEEFSGSYAQDVMRFSDEEINDAFEGDPDTYWNID